MVKYIRLIPLLFLCAWVPSSGDVTKLSTAERVVLEGYAAALALLPDGAQQAIQKKIGLWVRDNKGGSIWGSIEVSGNFPYQSVRSSVLNSSAYVYDCSFKIGSFDYFPYQANYTQRTCTRSGFVVDYYGQYFPSYVPNMVSWASNYDNWKMVSYSGAQSPSSVLAHCAVGRGYSSAGLRDGIPGNYFTDVLYYLPAANCQMTNYSDGVRVLLDIPLTANMNETGEMLGVLKAAKAGSLSLPVVSTYTNGAYTLTLSTSIDAAINYIENGVVVDGPIGQTSTIYPDTIFSGISSGTYTPSGSSTSVNVVVNVSTQEIVDRLDSVNDKLSIFELNYTTADLKNDFDSVVDSAAIAAQVISLASAAVVDLQDTSYFQALNQFIPPAVSTSTTWEPCFDFDWSSTSWHGPQQHLCFSDFPTWNSIVLPLIQWALFFITALWSLEYMWRD